MQLKQSLLAREARKLKYDDWSPMAEQCLSSCGETGPRVSSILVWHRLLLTLTPAVGCGAVPKSSKTKSLAEVNSFSRNSDRSSAKGARSGTGYILGGAEVIRIHIAVTILAQVRKPGI